MGAKVISTVNIKGGIGKTTTTGCESELLTTLGKRVLNIDMDPQGNLTQLFGRYQTGEQTINDLLMLKGSECCRENVIRAIQKTDNPLIDIIGSNEELTFVSQSIAFDQSRAQQLILKKIIDTVKEDYDYILIDNTPFFNILTINSLCASDYVITPVGCSGYSYAGLQRLLREIYRIKDEFNRDLEFLGAFITNANIQKVAFKEMYSGYKQELKEKFLNTYIRQDKNVEESTIAFVPLYTYSKNTNAVVDYRKLLAELNILDEKSQKELEKIILEKKGI